jgi:hypothetical protein
MKEKQNQEMKFFTVVYDSYDKIKLIIIIFFINIVVDLENK